MFSSWGKVVAAHRIVVLFVVAIFIGGLAAFGSDLNERLSQGGWDDPDSEWARAEAIENENYGRDAAGDVVMLYRIPKGTSADDPVFQDPIRRNLDTLAENNPEQVAGITSWVVNKSPELINRQAGIAIASIQLKGEGDDVLKNFQKIEDQLDVPGIDTERAGQQPVANALDQGMHDDLQRAEIVALPLVLILLFFVFGGLVAALLPVVTGILSILGSLGLLALITHLTPVNSFAQSVVTLIGLGLAIDYGLFVVSRFREELAAGYSSELAVKRTVATAGRTVVFSAVMVAVSLSGLLIFPQIFLKSVAYGAIAAVVLAALLSVTVLPAILGLLGPRVDMWGIDKLRTSPAQVDIEKSVFATMADWSRRRPWLVAIPIVAVLILLIAPFSGVQFGGINEKYLPPSSTARVAQETFDETFPASRTDPIRLVVVGATPQQLSLIRTSANEVPGLTGQFGFAKSGKTDAEGNSVVVLSAGLRDRDDREDVISALRAFPIPAGTDVLVGGSPALEQDSIRALIDGMPIMGIYVLVATTLLMFLAFGSLVLPIKAVIMNLLGLGATLGVLTWVFVDGYGSDFLGFTPGPLMSPVVVLIMAIIYGLSTDYEVFLLSRMVEAREKGATTAAAIRTGVAQTGHIITSAALILIVVTGAFAFSDIVMMKYISYGMIVALALDATVIRMLLVPAVMSLLGDDCWWAPRWMKNIQEKVGLQEHDLGDEARKSGQSPSGNSGSTAFPSVEGLRARYSGPKNYGELTPRRR